MNWKDIATATALALAVATGLTIYIFAYRGLIPCDVEDWPQLPFNKAAWSQTESKKRYVYARSLVAYFSQSKLKRSEIIEMLGMPENEDHSTHDLEYFIGETRFCPFAYVTTLDVGFAPFGQNKAAVRFD